MEKKDTFEHFNIESELRTIIARELKTETNLEEAEQRREDKAVEKSETEELLSASSSDCNDEVGQQPDGKDQPLQLLGTDEGDKRDPMNKRKNSEENVDSAKEMNPRRATEASGNGSSGVKVKGDVKAMLCQKCKQAIVGGQNYVTYEGQEIHRDCFTCTNCHNPHYWSGQWQKYLSRDGKTYCQPCNDELFKSKCENCKKPITGLKVTWKDGRTWHKDCFTCSGCNEILGGTYYLGEEQEVFCEKCA